MEESKYLKAKFQIGSCKGPIEYSSTESVFHAEDVPQEKRRNKAIISKWKREGCAPGEKKGWNISVHPGTKAVGRTRTNFEHDRSNMYQYNYRAEQLPPKNPPPLPKSHKFTIQILDPALRKAILQRRAQDPVAAGQAKRIEEMPAHSSLADKPSWNNSTYFSQSSVHTSVSKKHIELKNYTPPHKLPLPRKSEHPEISESTQPILHTRSRCSFREKHLVKKTYHSGVFAFNENEGQWMWSDTGSCVWNSPGDVVKVKDPTAPNFASPTSVK